MHLSELIIRMNHRWALPFRWSFFCLVLISPSIQAQPVPKTQLQLEFQSVHIGRNLSLNIARQRGLNYFSAGVNLQLNRQHYDYQDHIYYKRFKATKWYEYIGAQASYQRFIRTRSTFVSPFGFVQSQVAWGPTDNTGFLPFLTDSTGTVYYAPYENQGGPFVFLQTYFGAGFNAHMTDHISLCMRGGIGGMVIFGEDPSIVKYRPQAEAIAMWSAGINWTIMRPNTTVN